MPNEDLRTLSKEDLLERLKKLRSERKLYNKPKTGLSKRRDPVLPMLQGIDEDIAAKILEELMKSEETT